MHISCCHMYCKIMFSFRYIHVIRSLLKAFICFKLYKCTILLNARPSKQDQYDLFFLITLVQPKQFTSMSEPDTIIIHKIVQKTVTFEKAHKHQHASIEPG